MFLKFITHDTENNTLETTWLEEIVENGEVAGYKVAKSRNYSAAEKAEFNADTGTTKYADMAGW